MAQRYGGAYSPDGKAGEQPPPGKTRRGPAPNMPRPDPAGARSNILFVPPAILAVFSINDGAVGLAMGLSGPPCGHWPHG